MVANDRSLLRIGYDKRRATSTTGNICVENRFGILHHPFGLGTWILAWLASPASIAQNGNNEKTSVHYSLSVVSQDARVCVNRVPFSALRSDGDAMGLASCATERQVVAIPLFTSIQKFFSMLLLIPGDGCTSL